MCGGIGPGPVPQLALLKKHQPHGLHESVRAQSAQRVSVCTCVCASARAPRVCSCVRACVRACVRMCVRACVRACGCVREVENLRSSASAVEC